MPQAKILPDPAKQTELLERWFASAPAKEILAQDAAKLAMERLRLADRVVELDREFLETDRSHQQKLASALKAHKAAEKQFVDTGRNLAELHNRHSAWVWRVNAEKTGIEDAMARTASPDIHGFIGEMLDVLDDLMRSGLNCYPLEIKGQVWGRPTRVVVTNAAGLSDLMSRIRRAISDAKAMMQLPDQSEVPSAISDLRRTIGSVRVENIPIEEREIPRPTFTVDSKQVVS